MDLKYFMKKLWYKVVYLLVVIVYLICLNALNRDLLTQNFDSPFMLLMYDDYIAIKYFAIAIILYFSGGVIIYKEIKNLKKESEEFSDIIIAVLTIILVVMMYILIFIFIDNPILRAIISVFILVMSVVGTEAS